MVEGRPKDRKEIMSRLRKRFVEGDRKEPFTDREYVKESKRLFKLYSEGMDNTDSATDNANYDIVTDLIQEIMRYEKAYNILIDYFDELSPESRTELDKLLEEVDL